MSAEKIHKIPLHVTEPSGVARSNDPITTGVPIPRGALTSTDNMALTDPSGAEVPLQTKPAATWPDGSVKWAHLDFQVDLDANQEKTYALRFGKGVTRATFPSPLTVRDRGKRIDVTTGPLRFSVDRTRFHLLDAVHLDLDGDGAFVDSERIVSAPGEAFVELEDLTGKMTGRYLASLDRRCHVTVDEAGPLRAVIKAEGWHTAPDGRSAIPFTVRIVAYANCSFLTLYHTFAISENPAEVSVKSLGLSLPVDLGDARYAVAGDEILRGALADGEACALFQDAPDHHTLTGPGIADPEGTQSGGWIDLNDGTKGVALFVRDMDRLHPKALEVSAAHAAAYLWPPQAGNLDLRLELTHPSPELDAFKREYPDIFRMSEHGGIEPEEAKKVFTDASGRTAMGVSKTHELVCYFHKGDAHAASCADMAKAFNRPLLAFVNPEWYIQSDALGKYHPYDPEGFPKAEEWFDKTFDWILTHQHEWSRWYGMIDYGDVQTRRDMVPGDWARFCCRWGWLNSEVEMYLTAFLQYLRTGDRKYFDFGEAYARHHMDVDTIHTHEDPRFIGMGHRHDIDHWGGGPGSSHQWVYGSLLYYYLTGYGRALDVANLIGDYFLGDPLRLAVEDGNASREAVDAWIGVARLWEATGDERYRRAAEDAARSYREKQLPNGLWHRLMIGYMAPGIVNWYQVSGSEDCEEIMRRFTSFDFKVLQTALGNPAPLYAYQYRLTGDVKYLVPGYREMMLNIPDLPEEIDPDTFKQSRIDVAGGFIYFMAALHDCGRDLSDYLPKTDGPGRIDPLPGCHFAPLDLRSAANRDPYGDPFPLRDVAPPNPAVLETLEEIRPLKEEEIGLLFTSPANPLRPGYHLVTTHSVYPTQAGDPVPGENFVGYPFGAAAHIGGVPFDLIDPAQNADKAVVVLAEGESAAIPVGRRAKRIHFLGHVYRRSPHRDIDMFADVEIARYIVHYADGTSDTVPLLNNRHMEDFKSPPYARDVHLVRDQEGRWAAGHLNVFTCQPQDKPIDRIEFVDAGAGYNPALLGVTLECEGEAGATEAVRAFRFGDKWDGGVFSLTAESRYTPEAGCGWTETGTVEDAPDRVLLKGENRLRIDLPDGTYDVALLLQSESPRGASIDLDLAGERRLDNVEISAAHPDRLELRTAVEAGRLTLGIRVNGMLGDFEQIALRELIVSPAPEGAVHRKTSQSPDALRFGWDDISRLEEDHTRYGGIICLDIHARKEFTVDLPDGKYDVELDIMTWYPGHPLHVNVTLQGERVEESLPLGKATCAHTVDVADGKLRLAVDTHLEDTHSRAPRWEIRALRIRPTE